MDLVLHKHTFTKNYNVLESDVFNPYLTDITLGFATEEAKEDTVAGWSAWSAVSLVDLPDATFAELSAPTVTFIC